MLERYFFLYYEMWYRLFKYILGNNGIKLNIGIDF